MNQFEQGTKEQEEFSKRWPIANLETITLAQYTNLERLDSFTYWLEKRTEKSGSIWGGSAFKFGIYKRADLTKAQNYGNTSTDGEYAWFSKYGRTKEETFSIVKAMIISIAKSSLVFDLEEIDKIDLGESVKWKIAFHYNTEHIIPIFKREVLIRASEKYGMAGAKKQPISALQKFLIAFKPAEDSTLAFSAQLWSQFNLDNFFSTVDKFLKQAETSSLKTREYPNKYHGFDVKVSFGMGSPANIPWIALMRKPNTASHGIYPVYLFYKEINKLILSFGQSDTVKSLAGWKNANKLQRIGEWHLKTYGTKAQRYGESYIHKVYDLDEELDPLAIQSDLDEILRIYSEQDFGPVMEPAPVAEMQKRYWIIAPGEQANKWEEFYNDNLIGINWDKIDDLSKIEEKEVISQQLATLYPEDGADQKNNTHALWQFAHEMREGDVLITKKGKTGFLGYGIVNSTYRFDTTRSEYKHIRSVKWEANGYWEDEIHSTVTKTLTDITKYSEYLDRLKRLIGIEQVAEIPRERAYWWLGFSPKTWNLRDLEAGQTIDYPTHNQQNIKRNTYAHFEQMNSGDIVIGYESAPVNSVVAIFEVKRARHLSEEEAQEHITLSTQLIFPRDISLESIRLEVLKLNDREILEPSKASIFKLSKADYELIRNLDSITEYTPYSIDNALAEVFMDQEEIERILWLMKYKKNIILSGPPGTGKTFIAKRLAHLMLKEKDDSKIEIIQFHQSYAYEDFMQGLRPREDGSFSLQNGIFYRFCKRAQVDPDNEYFFIIDEINRGHMSKIFGELMLLLEADKRGPEHAISLTYGSSRQTQFYIPKNLYLIGTMNTADRSLAVIDYALRRRFAFINVLPLFNERFKVFISDKISSELVSKIAYQMAQLNEKITSELGPGYQIGHSYFCNTIEAQDEISWYEHILRSEIEPLLQEYWHGEPETLVAVMNLLK